MPVIEPKDAPAYQQDPYVTELMHCQHAPSEIVLSLLLRKHDWSDLSVAKRQHVQAKLSKFFAIPKVSAQSDALMPQPRPQLLTHLSFCLLGIHYIGFGGQT